MKLGSLKVSSRTVCRIYLQIVIPNILVTDNDGLLYPNESKGVKQNQKI